MHYYASDSTFRGANAFLVLAAIAALVAYALSASLAALNVSPAWWIEIPSVLGAYGLVVAAYDGNLWRHLSNIPDLRGTWVGEVSSNFDGQHKTICVARIQQTWTRISIELETDQSMSRTTMAALFQGIPGEKGLNYEYLSEPKGLATETMQAHRGTAHLRISSGFSNLSGSYYTGRGRGTVGEISLRRISTDLLDTETANTRANQ